MHILNLCTLTRTDVGHFSSGTGQLSDLAGEEPSRAGGRTYPAREVARVHHLFCFTRQSATSVVVLLTRS
jgi:hypothetical protein